MAWASLTDVQCYYELLGQGEPLLLIPGLGTTCRLWDPVASELAEHFTLILPDARGVGRSGAKRPARTLADYAVDAVELMDALQLDRVHVLGISLGGVIAQRLALDHPSRVDRLVLVSCTHHFGPYLRGMAMLLAQTLRHFPWELYVQTVELLGTAPRWFDTHQQQIREKVQKSRACGISRSTVVRQLQCLNCSEVARDDFRIVSPTLVVAGEHDALIPSCYAREMADEIPGSEMWVVPGGGHNPITEMPPEIVLPRIIEFLKRKNTGERAVEGSLVAAGA
jgi:pimeloyl-ACP methyl ester carboxylesterase